MKITLSQIMGPSTPPVAGNPPAQPVVLVVMADGSVQEAQIGPGITVTNSTPIPEIMVTPTNYGKEVGLVPNNLIIMLKQVPLAGSDSVFINGLLQSNGNDYTLSGAVLTLKAFNTGDYVEVHYRW